ncbi:THAP domain protein [Plakobranchus ocellatus]|uniref:THAP domain protein n=1 Tax=Plakobranchus ocellatus TaxID=259542 RepID=A0AAV3Z6S5_9GAST|nr:THAP domain protein [Plakobranchus ocellatus]
MPQCVGVNCTNASGETKGIPFHRFPKDKEMRARWVANLRRYAHVKKDKHGRMNKHKKFVAGDNTRLCGKHFEDDCYTVTGKRRRLKKDAVPTLFDFPSGLVKTIKTRKPPTDRSSLQIRDSVRQNQSTPGPETATSDTPAPCMSAQIPLMILAREHSYNISLSPRKLKRKLDETIEICENMKNRLKYVQKQNQKLRNKIKTLTDVVEKLKAQV